MSVARKLWDDTVMRDALVQLMRDADDAIIQVYDSNNVVAVTGGDD